MKYLLVTSAVLSAAMLSGCATQGKSTVDSIERSPVTVSNEIVVSKPYSQVWDNLVRELSKSYYVINNIDKESRIINVSFSSTTPQEYVDCGSTTRIYTEGDATETFKYDVAASARYKVALPPKIPNPNFSDYAIANRTTALEGRSNIYLAPDEADKSKTRVAINTRYILTIALVGEMYRENFAKQIVLTSPAPQVPPTVISFNTNKPVKHDFGQGQFSTCFGNGKLETEVLSLVKN